MKSNLSPRLTTLSPHGPEVGRSGPVLDPICAGRVGRFADAIRFAVEAHPEWLPPTSRPRKASTSAHGSPVRNRPPRFDVGGRSVRHGQCGRGETARSPYRPMPRMAAGDWVAASLARQQNHSRSTGQTTATVLDTERGSA